MQPSNYLFLGLPHQLEVEAIHGDHISRLHHRGYHYRQYLVLLGIKLPLRKAGIQALQCRAIDL